MRDTKIRMLSRWKKASPLDFQQYDHFKYQELCLCARMLVIEWKESAFIEKVNSRCFCLLPTAILVHQNGTRGGRKGLRWCGFALFLVRFCGNFYFNSRYCGFKTLSGLRLLQPLSRGFRWKKVSTVITPFRTVGAGCSASASQVFCFTAHQGSLYQLTI